ncbi:hypothetical protein NDU88_007506 [Pleurodeles waltl]|uniref:Uncharacterized protein n=1 Tax=Pleurodeles waltl TaxID=8319 RepID=A0AAV7QKY9_PLEWA|nr:hypothetical protein NDU88_007506 [Pleurodeles waltl]
MLWEGFRSPGLGRSLAGVRQVSLVPGVPEQCLLAPRPPQRSALRQPPGAALPLSGPLGFRSDQQRGAAILHPLPDSARTPEECEGGERKRCS